MFWFFSVVDRADGSNAVSRSLRRVCVCVCVFVCVVASE